MDFINEILKDLAITEPGEEIFIEDDLINFDSNKIKRNLEMIWKKFKGRDNVFLFL